MSCSATTQAKSTLYCNILYLFLKSLEVLEISTPRLRCVFRLAEGEREQRSLPSHILILACAPRCLQTSPQPCLLLQWIYFVKFKYLSLFTSFHYIYLYIIHIKMIYSKICFDLTSIKYAFSQIYIHLPSPCRTNLYLSNLSLLYLFSSSKL